MSWLTRPRGLLPSLCAACGVFGRRIGVPVRDGGAATGAPAPALSSAALALLVLPLPLERAARGGVAITELPFRSAEGVEANEDEDEEAEEAAGAGGFVAVAVGVVRRTWLEEPPRRLSPPIERRRVSLFAALWQA